MKCCYFIMSSTLSVGNAMYFKAEYCTGTGTVLFFLLYVEGTVQSARTYTVEHLHTVQYVKVGELCPTRSGYCTKSLLKQPDDSAVMILFSSYKHGRFVPVIPVALSSK